MPGGCSSRSLWRMMRKRHGHHTTVSECSVRFETEKLNLLSFLVTFDQWNVAYQPPIAAAPHTGTAFRELEFLYHLYISPRCGDLHLSIVVVSWAQSSGDKAVSFVAGIDSIQWITRLRTDDDYNFIEIILTC